MLARSRSYILPAGAWIDGEEYLCDMCPFCGKDRHFYWNVSKRLGHCKKCSQTIVGVKKFNRLFSLGDDDFSISRQAFRAHELKLIDQPGLWSVNAWDHPKSRRFISERGLSQQECRAIPFWAIPEEEKVACPIDPLSPELQPAFLFRHISGYGKWMPKKGVDISLYAFGLKQWKLLHPTPAPILLCEGIFDILSAGLHGIGVALLGTNFSKLWPIWLKRNASKVVVAFDPDAAGRAAERRVLQTLKVWGIPAVGAHVSVDPKNLYPGDREHSQMLELLT